MQQVVEQGGCNHSCPAGERLVFNPALVGTELQRAVGQYCGKLAFVPLGAKCGW